MDDKIIFLQNDNKLKVRNGQTGFVTKVTDSKITVQSGEAYEPGTETMPTGLERTDGFDETFKVEIDFVSGTRYTLAANGDTLWLECSDKDYGCKYKINPVVSNNLIRGTPLY